MINVTNLYEITYIIYYLVIYVIAYYIYYKYIKYKLNNTIDIIIRYIKDNNKIKSLVNLLCFVDEIKYIKNKISRLFRKLKNKRKK